MGRSKKEGRMINNIRRREKNKSEYISVSIRIQSICFGLRIRSRSKCC